MQAIHEALLDCLNAGLIGHHPSHCIVCNPAAGPHSPDHDGYDNHDDFGLAHQVAPLLYFMQSLIHCWVLRQSSLLTWLYEFDCVM